MLDPLQYLVEVMKDLGGPGLLLTQSAGIYTSHNTAKTGTFSQLQLQVTCCGFATTQWMQHAHSLPWGEDIATLMYLAHFDLKSKGDSF